MGHINHINLFGLFLGVIALWAPPVAYVVLWEAPYKFVNRIEQNIVQSIQFAVIGSHTCIATEHYIYCVESITVSTFIQEIYNAPFKKPQRRPSSATAKQISLE